jgi:hypothetical protein
MRACNGISRALDMRTRITVAVLVVRVVHTLLELKRTAL